MACIVSNIPSIAIKADDRLCMRREGHEVTAISVSVH